MNEKYTFYCKANSEKSPNVLINNLIKTNNWQVVDRRMNEQIEALYTSVYYITFYLFFSTGRKFDLRVYVLVTSVRTESCESQCFIQNVNFAACMNQCVWTCGCVFMFQYVPLRAWLYRDGFARFSSTRFSLSSIDDKCILFFLPS